MDVWLLNEFDLGMARSAQEHTVRLLAYALKLNYASTTPGGKSVAYHTRMYNACGPRVFSTAPRPTAGREMQPPE